mgnify:FL=1
MQFRQHMGTRTLLMVMGTTYHSMMYFQIFLCIFLCRAYIIAQERLGKETMKWIDGCCKEAVYECNKLGLNIQQ